MASLIQHRIKLPQYTRQDKWIFLCVMPIIVIVLNMVLLKKTYFSSLKNFLLGSMIIFLLIGTMWQLFTAIAIYFRDKFPAGRKTAQRLCISIICFVFITDLTITLIFWLYNQLHLTPKPLSLKSYLWSLLFAFLINVFVTLLHEGVSAFEKWRTTFVETDQLKKEYVKGKLLGLKGQLNPHFLFNSFNSLSSLINENTEKAEQFLNEMSKVFSYMLSSQHEHLVTLTTELHFLQSYYYLLKERYGEAFHLDVDVLREHEDWYLPPFTLQLLLENIIGGNVISKDVPLYISITTLHNGWLEVSNSIHQREGDESVQDTEGLMNITNKIRLLTRQTMFVNHSVDCRTIRLPLLNKNEMSIAV